ncbi:MAG: Bifunctional protein FolD [Berkelbacteria bacterium GW2011_GWB1_38_5]|uniref:Bifunctional protein FolD n=1 Tax=Berkelbacteria bacterium GW2011_GWB1_38_5 TaxID=1618336 RepID=A0A0G0KE24_9BACT|nr:MAG: Bifunctional protein FolD [Berkelbacteria bacterium GW2011_GWB1_38_5]
MVLLGKPVAENIYLKLKKDIEVLQKKHIMPTMGVILVGEDPASLSYVKIKEKIAKNLGIGFKLFHLPGIVSEKEVEKSICELNINKYISGIIVQLPLPTDFQTEKILKQIKSEKDVDGFYGAYPAPTVQAILEILKFYKININDKKIVIVGYGRLVGQPLEKMLLKLGLKPVVCDSKTAGLKAKILEADIIVTAVGVQSLIKSDMVKAGTIIIDAGNSEVAGKMVGDVDPKVYFKIKAYSPVPGGVGPVTVACLMKNVVDATKMSTS